MIHDATSVFDSDLLPTLAILLALSVASCERDAASREQRPALSASGSPSAARAVASAAQSAAAALDTSTRRPGGVPEPAAEGSASATEGVDPSWVPGPLQIRTDAGIVAAARADRILHIGDSMVPLVANYLRQLVRTQGRDYWVDSRESSSTLSWAEQRLLQEAMYKYDPQVILISLGSNELFDPEPERRAPAIRQLVQDTRGRTCLWLGPPAWKKDRGFIRVLKENLGHCRYFDSTRLKLPRMQDGRHPNWTGGYRWASAVWQVLGGTEPVPTGSRQRGTGTTQRD